MNNTTICEDCGKRIPSSLIHPMGNWCGNCSPNHSGEKDMSDGFTFKANRPGAPVTVEMRIGWAETATANEVADALTNAYGEAMQQMEAKLGICHL